jgi:hypothetical protein
MAREDRDGSGIEMGFIGMSPVSFGKYFLGRRNGENPASQMVANHGIS